MECCGTWHRGVIWDFVLTAWAGHSTTGARLGLGNLAGPGLTPIHNLGKAVQWYKFVWFMNSTLRGFLPPSASPLSPVPQSSLCSCPPAVVLPAFCFLHSSLEQSTTSYPELRKRGNEVLQDEVKLGINPTSQLSCGTC